MNPVKNMLLLIVASGMILFLFSKNIMQSEEKQNLNPRPVIGVLTQPYYEDPTNTHYIAASYVNWLESAGARSIAIPQNADNATIDAIFPYINGLLLTGGDDVELQDSVRRLWDLAIQSNDAGDVFPIWASCLGYEMIVTLVGARNKEEQRTFDILLKNYDSENLPLSLDFTDHVSLSKLFANPRIRHIAKTENVTMNNHRNGITPETFESNPRLSKMFRIISTNVDRKNQPFVSTIEAKNYPIYGVQWHPEKNMFEYNTYDDGTDIPLENIPHTGDAARVSFEMSMIFVDKARENSHVFKPMKELPFVWNYPRVKSFDFQVRYLIDVVPWNKGGVYSFDDGNHPYNEMQADKDRMSSVDILD